MNEIYNIKYVDAFYIDSSYGINKKLGKTKLFTHEAYGYVQKNKDNIVITFIKEKTASLERINKKNDLVKGLIIPDTAILSESLKFKTDAIEKISLRSYISVVWRDVVFVSNEPRYDCSLMYTEGFLFRVEKDHIVIKNPETIRTYPKPIKNHPSEKPLFYIIPKSFIKEIVEIK
ncbi:hypothetical protein A2996_02305 [Candidatus Campbellbacteria bacterium RIFCSPLOWO2_01_FULL_34_15]|uniref:Uncharacterized protein n=2 Tax=Candidatus Campbelliibacteriota TaxID=1752727 RepID=A0A1F5ENN2_9BACT|nr:MAG: hypothetical protein A2996_02305 [Candidatus Campbellbacteria bacterium RIFCSPLOWO2_01_FULL_34_15]OGD69098.1 MAG: hypothetical protein A2811_02245 [Candidatus Campbellbacteria bacterium RIFCSPHIGHO2_01_FULL_34_10]